MIRSLFLSNYHKVVREQSYVNHAESLYNLNLSEGSGFDSIGGTYDLKEIRRAINMLPDEYKELFSMHVAGFKLNDIARKLGLSLETVKKRMVFTRQQLQDVLNSFS